MDEQKVINMITEEKIKLRFDMLNFSKDVKLVYLKLKIFAYHELMEEIEEDKNEIAD